MSASLVLSWFISLYQSRAVDAFHTLFLSFQWLLGRVVANKLSYQVNQQMVFCVFITYSYGEVTTRSDWNLRGSATFTDYLEPWCYMYLCGAVALYMQKQQPNKNSTSLCSESQPSLSTIKTKIPSLRSEYQPSLSTNNGLLIYPLRTNDYNTYTYIQETTGSPFLESWTGKVSFVNRTFIQ